MEMKPDKIHKNSIPMKIKQPYHTVLNTNNKITHTL